MKLSWLSSCIIPTGFAATSLAASVQSHLRWEWTVSDARRTKSQSNTTCTWHIAVTDSGLGQNPNTTFQCDFKTTASPGQDCGYSTISQKPCTGNTSFMINGLHQNLGFVMMTLTADIADKSYLSENMYALLDADLDTGFVIPPQSQPVFPHDTTRQDELVMRQQQDNGMEPSSSEWSVEDLFRDVDVERRLVTVGFRILDGTLSGARCVLSLTPPEGVDIQTWEWYNRACQGSGFYASWGYMATGDAGIMTIVKNGQAFFGFSNIKSTAYLGDAGPNPVSPCHCG
ncbi:hypothetical protein GGR54DRAFT_644150 [Hypoxylon sp. NC1633]|nr:hypothetical protein GGR54DRAFT_644150 [Hypoxylon sp. NC1633]